jgi:hypothetical protein
MLALQKHVRRASRDIEHGLQCTCVTLFRYRHPDMARVLFAVPNGGRRDAATGSRLKDEGVTAGVADLILLHRTSRYGALCIEMKTDTGRQSPAQKEWQREAENNGSKYVVVRSLEEFTRAVEAYLNNEE